MSNKGRKNREYVLRILLAGFFIVAIVCTAFPGKMESVSAGAEAHAAIPLTKNGGRFALPEVEGKLIPLGKTTGIKLFSKGTMIVGFSDLESSGSCPAKEAGLREGDVLLELNGQSITGNEGLCCLLEELQQEKAVFTVLRSGKEEKIVVNAVLDTEMQRYRIGAWIRDSIAGIGTITFVDPDNGVFGALGHGICDADTGELICFGSGSVMPSRVERVEKSKSGTPGQLCGSFDLVHDQGFLADNCRTGIYGMMTDDALYAKEPAVDVAEKAEIREGPAVIRSCTEGTEVQEYDVQILKVYAENGERELLLEVTDPNLLDTAGGIVQGQSGSPILQDGKLVGAVTHVLLKNPHRGYGISMETMLKQVPAA